MTNKYAIAVFEPNSQDHDFAVYYYCCYLNGSSMPETSYWVVPGTLED